MSTPGKVVAFLAGLAAVFGAAFAVGAFADPKTEPVAGHDGSHKASNDPPSGSPNAAEVVAGGLEVSQAGYTLHLGSDRANAGIGVPIRFRIAGPDDATVTEFDLAHEKRLHLIAVRRDFTGFQHVHPTMATDGTWSTTLDLAAGSWRVFADFKPTDGDAVTLGADLEVAGDYRPVADRVDSRTDEVDGYTVELEGDLAAGGDSVLEARVSRDGRPVALEPYLGALGHLVALRRGDLAYLHVHPEGTTFHASVPSAGTYELFLDFKHDGVVRTAAFTMTAPHAADASGDAGEHTSEEEGADEHGH